MFKICQHSRDKWLRVDSMRLYASKYRRLQQRCRRRDAASGDTEETTVSRIMDRPACTSWVPRRRTLMIWPSCSTCEGASGLRELGGACG